MMNKIDKKKEEIYYRAASFSFISFSQLSKILSLSLSLPVYGTLLVILSHTSQTD